MPTVIQRTHAHYEASKTDPNVLNRAYEATVKEIWPAGQGRTLGRKTPPRALSPDQSLNELEDLDQTPSARAKVLPWVEGIETQSYMTPDGMYGPYTSQPPTRPQTEMLNQQQQISHPHPFTSGTRPPIDSIISDGGELKRSHAHKREHGPESEAMSRGIAPPPAFPFFAVPMPGYAAAMTMSGLPMGMTGPPLPEKPMAPVASERVSSPGMGTFGREASQLPEQPSAYKAKSAKSKETKAAKPKTDKSTKLAKSAKTKSKAPSAAVKDHHEHHAHPEHPFSHIDLAASQARAQDRALALHEAVAPETVASSEPSFGQNAFPFIPPPVGVMPGRPVIVMRNSGGLGISLGGIGGFGALPSAAHAHAHEEMFRQRDLNDRSAYVETIDDEDTVGAGGNVPNGGQVRPDSSTQPPVHHQAPSSSSSASSTASEQKERHHAPPAAQPAASSAYTRRVPVPHHSSNGETQSRPAGPMRPVSMAPTTQTEVDRVVKDSHFHDDALCQMLDAARLNSVGEEARRALRTAARQRVGQLKDLHTVGRELPFDEPLRQQQGPSTQHHSHTAAQSTRAHHQSNSAEPPEWAKTLIDRIALLDAKLNDLERKGSPYIRPSSPPSQDVAGQVVEELIHGAPGMFPFQFNGYGGVPMARNGFSSQGVPHMPQQAIYHQGIPSWGSEVELPVSESMPPAPLAPPTIQVMAPTDSNAGRNRAPTQQAPTQVDIDIIHEQYVPDAPQDRDLPLVPSKTETMRSFAKTHQTHDPATVKSMSSYDVLVPPLPSPTPWDAVTQRLYNWALVWMEKDFVEALESISLGSQVDEFALTIYTMMIFKRNLRHRMTDTPPLACDKLFVPPNMSEAINRAVHAKRFADAQQILEELWYPFGFKEPPRIIVALAKHRNDGDHWAAHRFDLTNGHLTTYSVFHQEKWLLDGRPFMWWHAIRAAWPQRHIPDPDRLVQRTEKILTAEAHRNDNSLVAANLSRNLLLGWRPERMTDLVKLRELVWMELKRLYKRKSKGTLVVNPHAETDHLYEI